MLFLPPARGEGGLKGRKGAIFTECKHTPFGVNSISVYNIMLFLTRNFGIKKGAMQSFCFARYHPYRFL